MITETTDPFTIQAEYRTADEPGYAIVRVADGFCVAWYPATTQGREDCANALVSWNSEPAFTAAQSGEDA